MVSVVVAVLLLHVSTLFADYPVKDKGEAKKTEYHEKKEGKPGDDFRKAAKHYVEKAEEFMDLAESESGKLKGLYLKLSSNYSKMAEIKLKAAKYADKNKWDKVKWDKYHKIEQENEELYKKVKIAKGDDK